MSKRLGMKWGGNPKRMAFDLWKLNLILFITDRNVVEGCLEGEQKQQQVRSREVTLHLTAKLRMLLLESYIQLSCFQKL